MWVDTENSQFADTYIEYYGERNPQSPILGDCVLYFRRTLVRSHSDFPFICRGLVLKQDRITAKDPRPTAFSVPKRNKKLVV